MSGGSDKSGEGFRIIEAGGRGVERGSGSRMLEVVIVKVGSISRSDTGASDAARPEAALMTRSTKEKSHVRGSIVFEMKAH